MIGLILKIHGFHVKLKMERPSGIILWYGFAESLPNKPETKETAWGKPGEPVDASTIPPRLPPRMPQANTIIQETQLASLSENGTSVCVSLTLCRHCL